MWKGLLETLGEMPVPLTIVGGVGAAVAGVGIENHWGSWTMAGWIVALAICIGIPALSTNLNRLGQGRRAARHSIKKVLAACASAYGHPQRHARANVMLPCSNNRRRVDPELTFNMENDG